LQVFRKLLAAYITQPIVSWLARTSITPNTVTWIGFFIILAAAVLAGLGHPFAAGWVMLLSGFFDIIDGALARGTNRVTRFGGVLDSTLDRLSEAVLLLGITAFFLYNNTTSLSGGWVILLIGITLTGSFLVSYIRSRAEAAGLNCQVGVFTRAERVIILALGLLLSGIPYALVAALGIISLLSAVTVVQRLLFVYRQTRGK
jgi:CDP-diacylglycerol--glycerol-3-phosphate 3-phosphatidyltransferase